MDNKTIFTKTAKGLGEAVGKTKALPRDFRNILKEINGKASVEELQDKLVNMPTARLYDALTTLVNGDYIHEFASPAMADGDLDFTLSTHPGDALTEVTIGDFLRELAPVAVVGDKPALTSTERPNGTDAVEKKARADEILREEQTRQEAEQQALRRAEEKARRKAVVMQIRRDAIEKYKRDTEELARKEAEAKARQGAEEQARREAEEKARRDAEEQAQREAEEKSRLEAEAKARQEAEEQARREAKEKARRDAEEQAQREAEEKSRLEAEAKARQEAEEQARREAEEKARRDAEEQARREAEEKARRDAEEQAQKQAEREAKEKLRLEAAAKAKEEAEERARRKVEEKKARAKREAAKQAEREAKKQAEREARRKVRLAAEAFKKQKEAEAQAKKQKEEAEAEQEAAYRAKHAAIFSKVGKHYRKPGNGRKYAALILVFMAVIGMVWVQEMSFDDQARAFEKTATEQFQQPVKIGKVHLALMPQPHWRLEEVSVGKDTQIKVARVDAKAELDTLFSDKIVFKTIELTSPIVKGEGLDWLLFGKSQGRDFKSLVVNASNAKLDAQSIDLPTFDARTEIGADGMWQKTIIEDANRKARIELQPKGETVQIELRADALTVLFGSSFPLEKINAKGTVSRNEIMLRELGGSIYGGFIKGNAKLKWGTPWSLTGDVTAREFDTARWAPQLLEGGKLEGRAKYALQARTANQLFSAPRLRGNFEVHNGTVLGVELASLLRNVSPGGKSPFSELSGGFVYESGKTQLRNMHLQAGLISANGNADVNANNNLNGYFTVDLTTSTQQTRANLTVSGTLKEPRFVP